MIGKKTITTNITESKCEDLNDQQIKIYNDQIKIVDHKICDRCKNKFWETLDQILRSYYYDQVDTKDDEETLPFDLNLINDDLICSKCSEVWKEYIDMDDQRFRLDLKKEKCYQKLVLMENNERMWDKWLE